MPINSFDDYPLTWKPDKSLLTSPLYISLAELLERDILSGRLTPNTKLPPQRELADFLDINLSTITRTFKLCETKGLIYATVGRGTFVSPNAALPGTDNTKSEKYIQLGLIYPYYQCNFFVADAAKAILQGSKSERLFEFDFTLGTAHHKQIAQRWLSGFQVMAETEDIMLTSGTQNGLVITLMSLFRAGDKIAADTYTYSNFISLAKQLNIQLIPIETDHDGMVPEALERQGRLSDIKGIYLMPSCANPTGITMPLERRQAIGNIVSTKNMLLIEDDTYGFTIDHKIPPMAALIPDHTIYLHGMSKSLAAGLRIAYLVFPDNLRKNFISTANNINLKIPMLNAEIACELIDSGKAVAIIEKKCMLSKERNQLFEKYFPEHTSNNPYAFFQWLPLPIGCNGYNFEVQAQNHGVRILCSDRFAVGCTPEPSYVRIATCSPSTAQELEKGLQIVQRLLDENNIVFQREDFIV